MYKKVADAQYRSKLSNELMMYHMKVGVWSAVGRLVAVWPNNIPHFTESPHLSFLPSKQHYLAPRRGVPTGGGNIPIIWMLSKGWGPHKKSELLGGLSRLDME